MSHKNTKKHNVQRECPFSFIKGGAKLQAGATERVIRDVERQLGMSLPVDLKAFLAWRDGGMFANDRFIIYSAGEGIHSDETLVASNNGLPEDYPLLNIARDAKYQFGIRKEDLQREKYAIFACLHDFGELDKRADSLRGFLEWMDRIGNTK